MRRLLALLPLTVSTILPASLALADGVVIASGAKGGYYHSIARGLRTVLREEQDITTEVVATRGSLENLAALDDAESGVNVALAQADALQHYIAKHPHFANEYVELSDAGKECAFLVSGGARGIDSLSDLSGKSVRQLAVGEEGSGAAVTWSYMTRLAPALRRAETVNVGFIEALLDLRSASKTSAGRTVPSAALIVQRPNAISTPLEAVLQNRDDLRFVPIRAGDLADADREDDDPAYTYEEVSLGVGSDYRIGVDTLCTRSLLLASRPKLTSEGLAAVGEAVLSSRQYLMPGSD